MKISRRHMRFALTLTGVFAVAANCSTASAQIVIGGGDGVVIGGGQGVRIGGGNGVQFGGGAGAKFGGPSGVQFGGGAGAKFGGPSGVQFGAGQGAKFGGDDGVQFGGGEGAKFGPVQLGGQPDKPADTRTDKPDDNRTVEPARDSAEPLAPTTLHYPKDAKEPLNFTLNDHKFKVEPGQTVNLRSDRLWVIRFAGSANGSERRFALPPGSYTFKEKHSGWNLFRDKKVERVVAPLPAPAEQERAPRRPSP